jgi:hypothetical protein
VDYLQAVHPPPWAAPVADVPGSDWGCKRALKAKALVSSKTMFAFARRCCREAGTAVQETMAGTDRTSMALAISVLMPVVGRGIPQLPAVAREGSDLPALALEALMVLLACGVGVAEWKHLVSRHRCLERRIQMFEEVIDFRIGGGNEFLFRKDVFPHGNAGRAPVRAGEFHEHGFVFGFRALKGFVKIHRPAFEGCGEDGSGETGHTDGDRSEPVNCFHGRYYSGSPAMEPSLIAE